jgi:hypothetical protein
MYLHEQKLVIIVYRACPCVPSCEEGRAVCVGIGKEQTRRPRPFALKPQLSLS